MDTYKKLIQIVIESQKEDILKELYFNKKTIFKALRYTVIKILKVVLLNQIIYNISTIK